MCLLVGGMIGGCSKGEDQAKIIPLEGRVEKIKIMRDGTGEITVSYHSDKQPEDIVGTARVTGQTEIMINGAVAKLSDIKEGERVRGDVRIEKKDGDRAYTALKIHVDRPTTTSGESGG